MSDARLALGIFIPLIFLVMTVQLRAESESPQVSPSNNVLYLHYNMTRHEGWMNTLPNETGDDGWTFHGGIFGRTGQLIFSFPMNPRFFPGQYLMVDPAQSWFIRVDHFEGRGRLMDVIGALTVGDYNHTTAPEAVDPYIFTFSPGCDLLGPGMDIIFNLSFYAEGGDFVGNDLHIITNGTSNLTMPILATDPDIDGDGLRNSQDPDDDNDGHNDTVDAYPLDVTRWMKPGTAHPAPLWLYASPLLVVLALIVAAVLWRRRKRLRSAAPPHK